MDRTVKLSRDAELRWKNVTSQDIARAIFNVVKGNCVLLVENSVSRNSVWRQIACSISANLTNDVDSYWAKLSYEENRKKVKTLHRELVRDAGLEYVPGPEVSDALSMQVFCFCKRKERDKSFGNEVSFIECVSCKKWYHGVCVRVNVANYTGKKQWNCAECGKKPSKYKIPSVLDISQISSVTQTPNSKTHGHGEGVHTSTPGRENTIPPPEESVINFDGNSPPCHDFQSPVTGTANISNRRVRPAAGFLKNIRKNLFGASATESIQGASRDSEKATSSSAKNFGSEHKDAFRVRISGRQKPDVRFQLPVFDAENPRAEFREPESSRNETSLGDSVADAFEDGNDRSKEDCADRSEHGSSRSDDDSANRFEAADPQKTPEEIHARFSPQNADIHIQDLSVESEDEPDLPANTTRQREEYSEGPISGHKTFVVIIDPETWEIIRPRRNFQNKGYQHTFVLKANYWTNEFATAFRSCCPTTMVGCKLAFKTHKVNESFVNNGSCKYYVCATAKCQREGCSMTYKFTLDYKPQVGDRARLTVSPKGTLKHDMTVYAKRKLWGSEREKAKTELRNTKAAVYRRRVWGHPKTNKEARSKGEHTEVQSVGVLRTARAEILAEDDMDRNILLDLMKRKAAFETYPHLSKGHVKGYIQEISLYPFAVLLYTTKQFELLRRLLKSNEQTCLHLDATGSIVAKLPEDIEQKRIYYYAMCITLPDERDTPMVPVLEFITNRHTTKHLARCLEMFFERFSKYVGTSKPYCGVRRFETDNSKALIAGVLRGIGIGSTLDYLRTAWTHFVCHEEIPFVHHICRAHAIKFMTAQIDEHTKGQPETTSILSNWMHRFLFSDDMNDATVKMTQAIILLGKRYFVPAVKKVLKSINGTRRSDADNFPWKTLALSDIPRRNVFYSESPFGFLALKICNRHRVELPTGVGNDFGPDESLSTWNHDDEVSSQAEMNPHYNESLLVYLIMNIFPITPLLNHSLITLNGFTIRTDTKNVSESWNKIVKIDEMQKTLPLRITRFIVQEEEALKVTSVGRLNIFESGLTRTERLQKKSNWQQPEKTPSVTRVRQVATKKTSGVRNTRGAKTPSNLEGRPSRNPDPVTSESTPSRGVHWSQQQDWDLQSETWKNKKASSPKPGHQVANVVHSINRIPWGGSVTWRGQKYRIHNTCSLDNQMQVLYSMYKLSQSVRDYVNENAKAGLNVSPEIIKACRQLDEQDYEGCRLTVLMDILKVRESEIRAGDFEGSEQRFLDAVSFLVSCWQYRGCKNATCKLPVTVTVFPAKDFIVQKPHSISDLYTTKPQMSVCDGCKSPGCLTYFTWTATGSPPLFMYSLAHGNETPANESDVLRTQIIIGQKYATFAYTIRHSNHFYAVIVSNGKRYIYDGTCSESLKPFTNAPAGHRLSTVWCCKVQG